MSVGPTTLSQRWGWCECWWLWLSLLRLAVVLVVVLVVVEGLWAVSSLPIPLLHLLNYLFFLPSPRSRRPQPAAQPLCGGPCGGDQCWRDCQHDPGLHHLPGAGGFMCGFTCGRGFICLCCVSRSACRATLSCGSLPPAPHCRYHSLAPQASGPLPRLIDPFTHPPTHPALHAAGQHYRHQRVGVPPRCAAG